MRWLLSPGCGCGLTYADQLALGGWIHVKTALVVGLVAYHLYCGRLLKAFAQDRNTKSHVWFRFFNEVPVFVLIAVVILVVVKPF